MLNGLPGRLMAASLLWMVGAGMAVAQEARNVPAGKRTAIGSFALYSPVECAAAAIPEAKVARQPQNGRLEVAQERRVVSGAQCKPFQMQVHIIYYTPRPGFRGADEASVDFFYNAFVEAPRPVSQRQSYAITVQ